MVSVPPAAVPRVAPHGRRAGSSPTSPIPVPASTPSPIASPLLIPTGLWAHTAELSQSPLETPTAAPPPPAPDGTRRNRPSLAEAVTVTSRRATLNPLAVPARLATLNEDQSSAAHYEARSHLNQFVSSHPVLVTAMPHSTITPPPVSSMTPPPPSASDRVRFSSMTPDQMKPPGMTRQTSINEVSGVGSAHRLPSAKVPSLPYWARSGDDGMSESNSARARPKKSIRKNRCGCWQQCFKRLGCAHSTSADFEAAVVTPNLQFGDRLLESFYAHEFYKKRTRPRIFMMCCFGLTLVALQLWLGFHNASRLQREQIAMKVSTTPAPEIEMPDFRFAPLKPRPIPSPAQPYMFEEPFNLQAANIRFLQSSTCNGGVWGSVNTGEQGLPSELSLYTLACVDQSMVDLLLLVLWSLIASCGCWINRIELISIVFQLMRTVLLIFFAQGMYSPCGLHQGSVRIIMDNLAVGSANITVFNALGLARVRRSCFISLAWIAGVMQVCIVMTASSINVIRRDDIAHLSLFIFMFAVIPLVILACRYRSEMAERESVYYAVMLEHMRMVNSELQSTLADMSAVKNTDIEHALPEGVVPSQIVHVAVMELRAANKLADALTENLPALAGNGQIISPEGGAKEPPSTYEQLSSHRNALHSRRESMNWTQKYGGLNDRSRSHINIAEIMDFTLEVKERINSALKLLSRSHDIYAAKPKDPYGGAILFHALGHDASSKPYQQPASTSRLQSNKTGGQASPVRDEVPAIDFPHLQHMPFMTGLGDIARNVGQNWTFDLLKVCRVTKDQALATTAMLLASPIAEKLPWVFDWQKFYSFIRVIQQNYGPSDRIPYHNRTHGAIHAHCTTVLLHWLDHSEHSAALESLAVLIASLCHDVGHPGKTNAYLVNANRRLAIIYNDISVLENVHACKTFETLQATESNFLSGAENEDYRFFRKMVIDLILATDMKLHFELINSYELRRSAPDFKPFDDDSRSLTLKLIMKAADLSHGALDWPLHQKLSLAVNEEFWAQGDAEEKLGLPKSPLCDRAKSNELAGSQVAFLGFVVLPLYQQLAAVDTNNHIAPTCETLITSNIAKWKVMAASHTPLQIPSPSSPPSPPSTRPATAEKSPPSPRPASSAENVSRHTPAPTASSYSREPISSVGSSTDNLTPRLDNSDESGDDNDIVFRDDRSSVKITGLRSGPPEPLAGHPGAELVSPVSTAISRPFP